ncbi:hypothetical protein FJ952_16595 [Mesorhizobium sp. B2-4-10]|uniref:hypothetical protein n=1 Tax=Mesorhizobium sp. B2-4-10 TaxID=2589939 RepID=UPI00112B37A9|nr:hypothetical protein [Mesorhizobium sp. B2-4-10]TPL16759.1 hypothetical protein FJ952_16595 [Mesorhizobium sp. B2-4-10]
MTPTPERQDAIPMDLGKVNGVGATQDELLFYLRQYPDTMVSGIELSTILGFRADEHAAFFGPGPVRDALLREDPIFSSRAVSFLIDSKLNDLAETIRRELQYPLGVSVSFLDEDRSEVLKALAHYTLHPATGRWVSRSPVLGDGDMPWGLYYSNEEAGVARRLVASFVVINTHQAKP